VYVFYFRAIKKWGTIENATNERTRRIKLEKLGLVTGRWFSPCALVSFTNKTDRHDITEILLKVALNTINHKSTTNLLSLIFKMMLYITLTNYSKTSLD
jgi:hypothetical protein